MLTFLRRLQCLLRAHVTGWRLPLVIGLTVFVTSWVAMALVEPGSDITGAGSYWWYFAVTAATVGYGDLYPETVGGRIVGVYVIVGGIVTLTVLFTRLAEHISTVKGRHMRGAVELDLDDHVVLLGYTPGRSERIVAELTAEGRLHVALCAWDEQAPTDPLPERPDVHFVRGDLTNAEVMGRACVERARTVIIDGRDDNETLAIAVAVDHANPRIHMVAALRDLERSEHFGYVNPDVQCVQWHVPYLLSEEALDPGITQVYSDLMRSGGRGSTYSLRVPPSAHRRTFGDHQVHVGRGFGATLLALRTPDGLVVSPAWDTAVSGGDVLYYVGTRRLSARDLDAAG